MTDFKCVVRVLEAILDQQRFFVLIFSNGKWSNIRNLILKRVNLAVEIVTVEHKATTWKESCYENEFMQKG